MVKHYFLATALFCLTAFAVAQTVTVDGTTNTPPTNYPTLTAALLSFDSGTAGPNAGNVAPNVINITNFGPHDVVIPIMGTGAVVVDGTAVQVVDGTEGFTIVGSGIKPLILVQNNGTATAATVDGIVIQNGAANVFTNMIFAPSPTGTVIADDLFFILGTGTAVTFNDCVLTALPVGSTAYTSINDIPAGFLDGTAAYDAANVQTEDNGIFSNASLTLNNTVLCQQGTTTSPDGMVLSTGSNTFINAGSVISANARLGIQISSATSNITVAGTLSNPVIFSNHNDVTNGDAIRPFGAGGPTFIIDHAIFVNNTAGINLFTGAPNLILTDVEVTNSIFANNGVGLLIGDDGTGTNPVIVSDCTFYTNTVGLQVNSLFSPRTVSITDCIFAGAGTALQIDDTIVGSLNNSALVGAGPDALTANFAAAPNSGALITQSPAALSADPDFASTAYTAHTTSREAPDLWLAVSASSYYTAGSASSQLLGGGVSNITPPGPQTSADGVWALYQ